MSARRKKRQPSPDEKGDAGSRIRVAERRLAQIRTAHKQLEQDREVFKRRATEKAEGRYLANRDRLVLSAVRIQEKLDETIGVGAQKGESDQALLDGLMLVRSLLERALDEEGLGGIPVLGLPFTEEVSRAVSSRRVDEPGKHGLVIEEVEGGLRIGSHVVRQASVVVGRYESGPATGPLGAALEPAPASGASAAEAPGAETAALPPAQESWPALEDEEAPAPPPAQESWPAPEEPPAPPRGVATTEVPPEVPMVEGIGPAVGPGTPPGELESGELLDGLREAMAEDAPEEAAAPPPAEGSWPAPEEPPVAESVSVPAAPAASAAAQEPVVAEPPSEPSRPVAEETIPQPESTPEPVRVEEPIPEPEPAPEPVRVEEPIPEPEPTPESVRVEEPIPEPEPTPDPVRVKEPEATDAELQLPPYPPAPPEAPQLEVEPTPEPDGPGLEALMVRMSGASATAAAPPETGESRPAHGSAVRYALVVAAAVLLGGAAYFALRVTPPTAAPGEEGARRPTGPGSAPRVERPSEVTDGEPVDSIELGWQVETGGTAAAQRDDDAQLEPSQAEAPPTADAEASVTATPGSVRQEQPVAPATGSGPPDEPEASEAASALPSPEASEVETSRPSVADQLARAEAAREAGRHAEAVDLYDEILELAPGHPAATAGRATASAAGQLDARSFVPSRTAVRSGKPGKAVAGFEAGRVARKPDFSGHIEFEITPRSPRPGDRYSGWVYLTNNGAQEFEIASMTFTTTIDGVAKERGAPLSLKVAPEERTFLEEVSGVWKADTSDWRLEVVVTTSRGDTFRCRLTWR